MDLVWFKLRGYKRFYDENKVNVDGKLIAFVGPNESGKTSLLQGMSHANHNEAFWEAGDTEEISRGVNKRPSDEVAVWTFSIDDEDRVALSEVPGGGDIRWFSIAKNVDGTNNFRFFPQPKRDKGARKAALNELKKVGEQSKLSNEDAKEIKNLKSLAVPSLQSEQEDLPPNSIQKIEDFIERFSEKEMEEFARIRHLLYELLLEEKQPSAFSQCVKILRAKIPRFLIFSDAERSLSSSYNINSYFETDEKQKQKVKIRREIPIALQNLLDCAQLSLEEIYKAHKTGPQGQLDTLLERGSDNLSDLLSRFWRQTNLTIRLSADSGNLMALVKEKDGEYMNVSGRSDGLRHFLSLSLFIYKNADAGVKPIVLIDEAENHLHYDAQADITHMFEQQELAQKVIYTTHSVGCLPEDLGTGIRLVTPHGSSSKVKNWFWDTGEPGLSPLLFGMGAETLAFLPMRRALVAEGAVDMILLPTMMKEATGKNTLGFQVVPGLSDSSPQHIGRLDREGSSVAYFTDGDEEGNKLASVLTGAGVQAARIVSLPKIGGHDTVLEDYVSVDKYVSAVQEELARSGSEVTVTEEDLARPNRPKKLEELCQAKGASIPKKRAIACHLITEKLESAEEHSILDPSARENLEELYHLVQTALQASG